MGTDFGYRWVPGTDGYRVPARKKILGTDGYRVPEKFSLMPTPVRDTEYIYVTWTMYIRSRFSSNLNLESSRFSFEKFSQIQLITVKMSRKESGDSSKGQFLNFFKKK